jgi:hypothetical protein
MIKENPQTKKKGCGFFMYLNVYKLFNNFSVSE